MEWIDVIEHSYRREIAAFGGIQASYIYDESGTLLVDKILQLETLTQDIAAIAKVINAPITLPINGGINCLTRGIVPANSPKDNTAMKVTSSE